MLNTNKMVVKNIHFRIRSPKSCAKFRTKDIGRPGHTRVTLCLRKPRKGERPAIGRKYESEVQRILVKKGTKTFRKDIATAKRVAGRACKRRGKKLAKVGEHYKCK